MRNIHVIHGDVTKDRLKHLSQFGITVERGFSRFDIEENETYFKLKSYIDSWGFSDYAFSKFDKTELDKAQFLCCIPNWQPLYPEPSGDGGFIELTYDTTNYCLKSRTGLVQKSPFRVKNEPKWSRYKAFILHWIFDEMFVHIDTYKKVFEPMGIKSMPLLRFKKDSIIESTVQLIIPESNVELNLEGYNKREFEKCNYSKYDLINYNLFPNFKGNVSSDLQIFKSKEYFSGGEDARKMIFVTQKMRQNLIKEKIELSYYPLSL